MITTCPHFNVHKFILQFGEATLLNSNSSITVLHDKEQDHLVFSNQFSDQITTFHITKQGTIVLHTDVITSKKTILAIALFLHGGIHNALQALTDLGEREETMVFEFIVDNFLNNFSFKTWSYADEYIIFVIKSKIKKHHRTL